jgi:hypothetical protein
MAALIAFFHLLSNIFMILSSTIDPGIIPKLNLEYTN